MVERGGDGQGVDGRKGRRDDGVKKERKPKNIREWNTKWAGGDETERDNCGEG